MGDLATYRIELNGLGRGTVEINGTDVQDQISSLEFQARPGQPPLLTVYHLGSSGVLEGDGIVQVQSSSNPQQAIVDFLSNVDAGLLEAEVLEDSGFGDSVMPTVLRVLRRWAGDADLAE